MTISATKAQSPARWAHAGVDRTQGLDRSEETLPRSSGPTPLQISLVQLVVGNRENLSPAAGRQRADEVSLRSSSCRSLRPKRAMTSDTGSASALSALGEDR